MNNKLSLQEWVDQAEREGVSFTDFCLRHQSGCLEKTPAALIDYMLSVLDVMDQSIATGLSGVKSRGGLVGGDARRLADYSDRQVDKSIVGLTVGRAVAMALAVGEANAAMGKIVAAPTAGSSGVLPAVLFALGESRGSERTELAKALVVAGAIGMVIASRASLAGAAGGCQAECGSAGAMAAGAAVAMSGGSPRQVGHAVAITLKNMLGLVCDPVAGLVEVPCVKRNAGAAAQAMIAAEMALADIQSVIPVDEVIDAMAAVGASMSCSLKETSQGGLAVTPTALALADKLLRG